MGYLDEIKAHWCHLAAASVGLASGYGISLYVNSIFAPHLLKTFNWSKSQFALLGVTVLLSLFILPIAGRLVDMFGVRRIAMIGVIASPFIYVAYSLMNGSFAVFFLINIAHNIIVGGSTTTTVYSRLIAERYERSRGLALSIAACAPPASGAVLATFLSGFIEAHGWRAGYLALAVWTATAGAVALLLIPSHGTGSVGPPHARGSAMRDYRAIVSDRTFQILAAGLLLCNLTLMALTSQLKLMLLDIGMASATASAMISFFAVGVVAGRLMCGLALDRFPAHIVAAIALGLPGIGLLILAAGLNITWLLGTAILILGLAMGSEFDIVAFLVMRFFRVEIYGSVYGLSSMTMALSSSLGSILLSFMLQLNDSFAPFLALTSFTTFAGAGMFLLLGRRPALAERDANTV